MSSTPDNGNEGNGEGGNEGGDEAPDPQHKKRYYMVKNRLDIVQARFFLLSKILLSIS